MENNGSSFQPRRETFSSNPGTRITVFLLVVYLFGFILWVWMYIFYLINCALILLQLEWGLCCHKTWQNQKRRKQWTSKQTPLGIWKEALLVTEDCLLHLCYVYGQKTLCPDRDSKLLSPNQHRLGFATGMQIMLFAAIVCPLKIKCEFLVQYAPTGLTSGFT